MSLREYTSLLKEATNNSGGGVHGSSNSNNFDGSNCIRVEHVLVLSLGEESTTLFWKSWANAFLDLARELVHATRIVAFGVSVFFILYGTSRLIESLKYDYDNNGNNSKTENEEGDDNE